PGPVPSPRLAPYLAHARPSTQPAPDPVPSLAPGPVPRPTPGPVPAQLPAPSLAQRPAPYLAAPLGPTGLVAPKYGPSRPAAPNRGPVASSLGPSQPVAPTRGPAPPPPPSPPSMGTGGRGCEGVADVPQQQQLPPRLLLSLSLPHLVLGEGGSLEVQGEAGGDLQHQPPPPRLLPPPAAGAAVGGRGSAAPAPPPTPPPPFLLHPLLQVQQWGRVWGWRVCEPSPAPPPLPSPTAAAATEGGGCVGAEGVVLGGHRVSRSCCPCVCSISRRLLSTLLSQSSLLLLTCPL
ncbi:unnamed protein product, partial [Closterium sp. NIES-53]